MRWLRLIAAKTPAAAFRTPAVNLGIMTAFVTIALTATFAFGPGTANAIEHSGEPSALARRSVPAMASPEVATLQMSTAVTGVLAAPQGGSAGGSEEGSPAGHDMHFQNRLSGNLYTVRTEANGAFSTMLPEGVYDLRGKHGAVIASGIVVGQTPVNLGQVSSPGPYNVWRLLDRQQIGQAIVKSPAPATAYLPNLGASPQPIAVTPVVNPAVIGGGPNGEPLAPAVVMPPRTYEQTQIPSGADVPSPGTAPPQMESPPGGGY